MDEQTKGGKEILKRENSMCKGIYIICSDSLRDSNSTIVTSTLNSKSIAFSGFYTHPNICSYPFFAHVCY